MVAPERLEIYMYIYSVSTNEVPERKNNFTTHFTTNCDL